MKRFLAMGAVAGMLLTSFISNASAKTPTTLYLHGRQPVGEAEMPDTWVDSNWMSMDSTKPADPAPKSMFVTNYVGGPNTQCSGNGILPVWKGLVSGTATGTVTVTLNTVATPAAKLNVELYPDGAGGCESSLGSTGYIPPAAAQVVDVAPGPGVTTVTFKNVKLKMIQSLVLQLSIISPSPAQVRVLYDSASFPSSVQLTLK